MLANFFQTLPLPADQMFGVYDIRLVVLSFLMATCASFIALDITGRLRDVGNTELVSMLWVAGGSVAMGAGIWSMHFIGMLAFTMPDMTMAYDPFWTAVSLAVAIFASAFALMLLKPKIIHATQLIMGGVILGFAIASMHYVGMHAMQISMHIRYMPGLFTLSIVIAVIASEVALYLALKSNQVVASMRFRLKLISAIIMGAAICGMHYTGMAAAVFTPLSEHEAAVTALDPEVLSIGIAMVAFCILAIAVFASTFKEAKNQQLLATARQAGMAEVAASVLHNVGNVLNSVNTSAGIIVEKILEARVNELSHLSQLINENKMDFAKFVTEDPRGKELPNYIEKLAAQWQKEQAEMIAEADRLIQHINHIKMIITMQQNLSRVTNLEQIVSVENLLDEVLLITGMDDNMKGIKVEKNVSKIPPVSLDRVKFMQIMVNLVNNAKDSLIASNNNEKCLTLTATTNGNSHLNIAVTDNGVGIPAANMTSIFSYGFTTKQDGHGFGLHSSALAAKEMGGNISIESAGANKGAKFTLDVPYKEPKV